MQKRSAMNVNGNASGSDNNCSAAGGDVDAKIERPDEEKANGEPICAVWHGYDVVLTENCRPSESKGPPSASEEHRSSSMAAGKLRESWRRTSSGQKEDYGWLRKLELRSDIPSMDEIRNWSFDVLQFEDSVLISVFIKMLEYYNLLETFGLNRKVLERYCREVMCMHNKDCYYQKVDIDTSTSQGVEEEQRRPEILCEYHNWYHAASCAHVCFLFLTLGGADAYLYPVEIFCIIMGALIHDLDHPGTNNDFEVKRGTSLAKIYKNDAVLERHSINMGLSMCEGNPGVDWLSSFASDLGTRDRDYVKLFISESVLATDPARHGDIVKEAMAFVEKGRQDYRSTSPTPEAPSDSGDHETPPSSTGKTYFNQKNPQHRLFIGRLLLHSADISNPLHSSFEVASDWAIRVTTEFTRQANKEKQLQLPVTTFMDGLDSKYKIAKLQIGFFQWMVKPLYNTIGILFPNLSMLEEWGERNCVEYQAVIDSLEEEQRLKEIAEGTVQEEGKELTREDTTRASEPKDVDPGEPYSRTKEGSATY